MKTVQIDKHVPLPPVHQPEKNTKWSIYPIKNLEIGDSFAVKAADKKTYSGIYSALKKVAAVHGIRIAVRANTGGFRVWRIAPKE